MNPNLTLGLTCVAGGFLGAALMFGTAPDTGAVPAAAPPVTAPVAPTPAAAAPAEPAVAEPAAAAAPAAAEPTAAPPVENDLGIPVADQLWGDPSAAPPPPAPTINPLRPDQRGGIVPAGGPYPADVRGVGQLFRDRQPAIDGCMQGQGPAANPGETSVMVRVRLEADPAAAQGGRIAKVETVNDPNGRYQAFLTCLSSALADAPVTAPGAGQAVVHWSVRRAPPPAVTP